MYELIEVLPAEVEEVIHPISIKMVERWLKFVDLKSRKSAETYYAAAKVMLRYFSDNQITNPTREDLIRWRNSLSEADKETGKKAKTPSTINLYITSARLYFRWLAQEHIYDNIADHLKSNVNPSHDHKKAALTTKQAGTLLKEIKGDSIISKRNRAMIALMLTAGLRTIEVQNATIGDMDGDFIKVLGKGQSDKKPVRIAPQVKELIQDYLSARGTAYGEEPLFISFSRRNKGAALSTQSIRKIIKSYLRSSGIIRTDDAKHKKEDEKKFTAHSLRHTAATQMFRAGATLEQVKQVLRHSNITTTMIYVEEMEREDNKAECLAANAIFGAA